MLTRPFFTGDGVFCLNQLCTFNFRAGWLRAGYFILKCSLLNDFMPQNRVITTLSQTWSSNYNQILHFNCFKVCKSAEETAMNYSLLNVGLIDCLMNCKRSFCCFYKVQNWSVTIIFSVISHHSVYSLKFVTFFLFSYYGFWEKISLLLCKEYWLWTDWRNK